MKHLWGLLLLVCFSSCEKSITIRPDTQTSLLVVDGAIEDGQTPVILLSTSLDYFSSITPQLLAASLVTSAKVTLADGSVTVPLKQFLIPVGGGFNLVYYGTDSTGTDAMKGQQGKTYTLQIEYNNTTYSAITTIPLLTKTVDSLWWKPAPQNDDTTKVVLMSRITDPKGFGNYIRYFTKVDSGNYLPGANSVFDDQVIDGSTYDAQVDQGINRNDAPVQDDYGYFKRGDTVTVKLCNIDKPTFDFWRTLEFSYQSVGNPFSSPTKVLGNVSRGGLGAFCGYAVQYKTLIIPK